MLGATTPEKEQSLLNCFIGPCKSCIANDLIQNWKLHEIKDFSVCQYYNNGMFVVIRKSETVEFWVFSEESEAVDFCLDSMKEGGE